MAARPSRGCRLSSAGHDAAGGFHSDIPLAVHYLNLYFNYRFAKAISGVKLFLMLSIFLDAGKQEDARGDGNGPEKPGLMRRAAALGLDNVHFIDPVAKSQVPALLAHVDVAYIGWQRQPLYRFGIAPNKLLDYMMAGCPILHAVEAGNDPVKEAGCGLTVAPEDPQAIADGVLALQALDAPARAALGRRGHAHALANHAYPVLGQRFLTALAGDHCHA